MPTIYQYYIPVLLNHEDKMAFFLHWYETDRLINSEEEFFRMLETLTKEHVPEPEKGTLPVIPLSITLMDAKQGPDVEPLKPKGNGKAT